MRWLLDEGIPRRIAEWLRERGDDVLVVAESEFRGQSDKALWSLAGGEARLVMTRDRGFLQSSVIPAPVGLVVLRAPDHWRAAAISGLTKGSLRQIGMESLSGKITIIEPGRIRQRPLPHASE
jgi:predicted nuclease of predicted toxin-antitoxin system